MRRYGIQHTEAALAELLEYMNPEHSDTILYEDFVTRIFTEPQVHRGVSPPKPDRVLKLPSPQRSPATSPSRSSHNNTLNVPVAHDEHGSSSARPSPSPQDATPALKMLRDSLTAQVGRGSSGVGKLLKTFTKFRQNAGAKGKFITFEDFKVALWRSGIRLPADKVRCLVVRCGEAAARLSATTLQRVAGLVVFACTALCEKKIKWTTTTSVVVVVTLCPCLFF